MKSWVLLFSLALASCASCPPCPETVRLPFQSLSTPEGGLQYFQAAMQLKDETAPRHQYLCFSEFMKRAEEAKTGDAWTLGNFLLVRDRVKERVEAKVGNLEDLEVGTAKLVAGRPDFAEVPVKSGGRTETVQMILEIEYTITFDDPTLGSVVGQVPYGTDPLKLTDRELLLRLALAEKLPTSSASIHRITFERAWKIAGVKGSDLAADIGRTIREAEKKPVEPKAAPPKPVQKPLTPNPRRAF